MWDAGTSEDTVDEEQFYDCLDEPFLPETHDGEDPWRDARDSSPPDSHVPGGKEAIAQDDTSGHTVCHRTEDETVPLTDKQAERICASSQASISGQSDFPAHRAAFYGEQEALLSMLREWPEDQQEALDSQGNTVLHVAVLRHHHEFVQALLDFGFPPAIRNARRWAPVDEAVSLRDRRMVKLLYSAQVAGLKALHRAKRGDLLATMREMPDYTFKLKWELGSSVLGLLLRRYAPHDTYEVWKRGTCMRVDGSLMGIDDKAGTLLPTWKRGHFSLLFDGAPQPASLLLVDHRKRTVVDLGAEKRKHRPDLDDEVALIMSEGGGQGRTKMKASDFRFARVRTWLGGDATERIEGWKTYVYEAAGKMKAVNITKAAVEVPPEATFEEYLGMAFDEDGVAETYIDPLSLKGAPKAVHASHEDGHEQQNGKHSAAERERSARVLTGRCWMAENFPMSLRQLLPVLDVVGAANKHLARVGRFLQKYGDMDLFPVKLQVPLLWTVYALVSFRGFHMLPAEGEASRPAFYQPPPEYTRKALHESLSKGAKGPSGRSGLALGGLAGLEDEDLY